MTAQSCVHSGTTQSISSNTTWSSVHYVDGDLEILAGATLTVTGQVYFKPGAILTVHKSANLIVDAGLLSTHCDDLWEGVYVDGDATLPQSPSLPWLPNPQGTATFVNRAIVEHAIKGVKTTGGSSQGGLNTGGRIFIRNSIFRNNHTGVEIGTYPAYGSGITGSYVSHIYNSQFYDDSNILSQPSSGAITQIRLFSINGINILGSKFSSDSYSSSLQGGPRGVIAWQASAVIAPYCDQPNPPVFPCPQQYWVYPEFENLFEGISMQLSGDGASIVDQAIFSNNLNDVFVSNNNNARITRNTIDRRPISSTNPWLRFDGIYMGYSDGYWIEENYIEAVPSASARVSGVFIVDGGPEDNEVYRNKLTNLKGIVDNEGYYSAAGAVAQYRNRNDIPVITGLQFLCNEFKENNLDIVAFPESQTITTYNGIRANQGEFSGGLPHTSTGNSFVHNNPHIADIFNHANIFFYLHNGGITDPQIVQLPNTVFKGIAPNTRTCRSSFDAEISEELFGDGLDYLRFGEGNEDSLTNTYFDNIHLYSDKLQLLLSLIDDGDSEGLINLVTECIEPSEMMGDLSALSPFVSEEVIRAMALNSIFTKEDLLTICLANPDATKSNFLINFLINVAHDPLDEADIDIIKASWSDVTDRSVLSNEISNHSYLASSAVNKLINHLKLCNMSTEKMTKLEDIYASWPSLRYKYDNVELLYSQQRYDEALILKNSLVSSYDMDEREAYEHETYDLFYDFRHQLLSNGGYWNDLNEAQLNELKAIAGRYLSKGSHLASGMLCLFHNECEEGEPYQYSNESSALLLDLPENLETDQRVSFRDFVLSPNPTVNTVLLHFSDDISEPVTIEAFDLSGRLQLRQEGLMNGEIINTSMLQVGVYFVTISSLNGHLLGYSKLIKQ